MSYNRILIDLTFTFSTAHSPSVITNAIMPFHVVFTIATATRHNTVCRPTKDIVRMANRQYGWTYKLLLLLLMASVKAASDAAAVADDRRDGG